MTSYLQVTETSEEYEMKNQLEEQLRSVMDKYKYKRRQIRELQEDLQVCVCVINAFCISWSVVTIFALLASDFSPSHLANLVSQHVLSRYFRSSDVNLFAVPRTFSKFDARRFSVCGPLLWNNMPTDINCADTLSQFKTLLKTHFYSEAFDT